MLKNTLHLLAVLFFINQVSFGQSTINKEDFFIDVHVGATQRITEDQVHSQFQSIKDGIQYGISAYYDVAFLKNAHLGVKYFLNSYNEDNNNSNLHYIAIGSIHAFSFGNKAKNELFFEPSVGYFYYNQEIETTNKQTVDGGNIGFSADLGYLRKLSKHFSIGLKAGYFNANLETYTLDNGITEERKELPRSAAIVLSSIQANFILRYQL